MAWGVVRPIATRLQQFAHVNCIFLVVKRKDHLEQIVTQTVESRRGTKLLVLCTQERYLAWCLIQTPTETLESLWDCRREDLVQCVRHLAGKSPFHNMGFFWFEDSRHPVIQRSAARAHALVQCEIISNEMERQVICLILRARGPCEDVSVRTVINDQLTL